VQEFRPASVIAADTELARRLHAGDVDAIRELVERYGAALTASLTPAVGRADAQVATVDVFVRARHEDFTPGDDFAPWLIELAGERAGSVDERRWIAATAIGAVDDDVRPALRRYHLEPTAELDDEFASHELRLQRRLTHVGEPAGVGELLGDPVVWFEPHDLTDDVLTALGVEPEDEVPVDDDQLDEHAASSPSPVSRALRPVVFGLGGAVLVLFVAIVGLSALSGTPMPPNYTVDLTPTGLFADVEGGEITVTARDAGIEIELDAITLPRRAGGLFYEGRLVLVDGTELSTGTFAEGVEVTLWGGVALEDAVAFRIVAGDVDDTEPSDDVVLKVDLPRP